MEIKVGTRGSKLALIQTNYVINCLKEKYPQHNYIIKIIKTTGDKIQHLSLDKIGDKGLFVKEIEEQLLDGSIDMAVHSYKDMSSQLPKGLIFAPSWKREDVRDVVVLKNYHSIEELPKGSIIATGSKRRAVQIKKLNPNIEIVGIRGNIDTRLKKLDELNIDGIVIAAAGLIRMNLSNKISQYLDFDQCIPACSQGALAIELNENNKELLEMISYFSDEIENNCIIAERDFLKYVDGSCHIPVGAICQYNSGKYHLKAMYGDEEGNHVVYGDKISSDYRNLGKDLAIQLRKEMKL